ncbi:MAG: phosphoribosylglycinamide formyltransferase [bacterium]
MLNKLQQKWNVSSKQLFLILCTFAITGTSTAYISRSITAWVGFDETTIWVWPFLLRIFILVFGYQIILMIVAFFFGQFKFFWNYEKKILRRMRIMPYEQVQLAIFASGKGSNAEKIIQYFENQKDIHIKLIVASRPDAGVLTIASRFGIDTLVIDKKRFTDTPEYVEVLKNQGVTHIVLAGFLWKVPQQLTAAYPNRIINIHPALLPSYGGKGMYGEKVHQAVIASGDKQSGITIHYVDDHYDNGKIIFQEKIEVLPSDTADSLAEKIHVLEHKHYPQVIRKWVRR